MCLYFVETRKYMLRVIILCRTRRKSQITLNSEHWYYIDNAVFEVHQTAMIHYQTDKRDAILWFLLGLCVIFHMAEEVAGYSKMIHKMCLQTLATYSERHA